MPSRTPADESTSLLQGTLDLLILRTLVRGAHHGQGIARLIQQQSEDVFLVDHGSLYLALERIEQKGWVTAKWGLSDKNRKARFYTLTFNGREQLTDKTARWRRIAKAMALILGADESQV